MFALFSSPDCQGPHCRPGLRRRRRVSVSRVAGWWLSIVVLPLCDSSSHAQQPSPPDASSSDPADIPVAISTADQFDGQLAEISELQIADWIASLGSDDFATRERAASQLMAVGESVLGRLERVAREHGDAEVRIRAGEIVKQLTRGDLKLRTDAFLAGKDVNFKGWMITQAVLGDSAQVRELFVQMLKSHPDLAASMEGTTRDRAMALKSVIAAVERKIFRQRQMPEVADAIALLLPTVDVNVPLEGGFEEILLSVLQKQAGTTLHRDPQLSGRFRALLGRWIPRSSIKNRDEILFYGLSWRLRETGVLGLRTLDETRQSETLVLAMQTIAQFGQEDYALQVAKLLDDKRPAAELGFANGKRLRTEVGDIAMATIARLKGVPLQKIGFAKESIDEKFAFEPADLGFPDGDELARAEARKKIDALIDPDVKDGL